jgi:hypothetical protein
MDSMAAIQWNLFVAIGTISLAGFTAVLAWSTRALARSSASDQRSQWRPLLIPGGQSVDEDTPGELSIYIRNVGRGPALGVNGELRSGGPRGSTVPGRATIVTPGDQLELRFRLNPPSPTPRGRVLEFRVSYYDIAEQWHLTELTALAQSESDGSKPLRIAGTFVNETGRYLLPGQGSRRARLADERRAQRLWSRGRSRVQAILKRQLPGQR